ncbi:MAG: metallophosphoesterase [Deltaproteobacteria bacterium]|nr:metallophosphoesterase [Deltaproteobacteria bacterium]
MRRRALSFRLLLLLLWLIAAAALTPGPTQAQAAALALDLTGQALDPSGRPVAGVLVSDEHGVTLTGPDGGFHLSSQPGRVVFVAAPGGWAVTGPWWRPSEAAAREPWPVKLAPRPATPGRLWAVLSDAHLSSPAAPPCGKGHALARPELPMQAWAREAGVITREQPGFSLVTGDLCLDADKGSLDAARKQMHLAAQALAMLPGPARALPGNHDVRYEASGVDESLWREVMGPARHVFNLPEMTVILLDNSALGLTSKGKPRSVGRLPDEALAWVKEVLAHLDPARPLVVASHFPLFSPLAGVNPLNDRTTTQVPTLPGLALRDTDQNAVALLGLLAGRRVAALLSGHQHADFRADLTVRSGRLIALGAPAFCGLYWQGDRPWGPLSFAPAYYMVTWQDGPGLPLPSARLVEVKF